MKNFIRPNQMKTGLFLILMALILVQTDSVAQDPRFTQSFAAPLRLNPALMGASTEMKTMLNYRSQWGGIDNGYSTARLTFHTPVLVQESSKLDAGLSFFNDQAGAFTTMNVSLAVGYSLKLTDNGHNMSVAIYGGYIQDKIDGSGLTFDEQYMLGGYDADNPNGEQMLNDAAGYADAGFGLLWFYNPLAEGEAGVNAFAGFSGYHLNTPNQSLTQVDGKLPARFTSIAGLKFVSGGKMDLTPNMRVSSQGGSQEVAAGIYADYGLNETTKLTIGSWYRQSDNIAFLLGFQYSKFTLGYSYDLPGTQVNRVIPNTNTHEITLSFGLDRSKELDYNPSPIPMY